MIKQVLSPLIRDRFVFSLSYTHRTHNAHATQTTHKHATSHTLLHTTIPHADTDHRNTTDTDRRRQTSKHQKLLVLKMRIIHRHTFESKPAVVRVSFDGTGKKKHTKCAENGTGARQISSRPDRKRSQNRRGVGALPGDIPFVATPSPHTRHTYATSPVRRKYLRTH